MDTKPAYSSRIDKALRYIDRHLDGDLSLETVADIACYSPFHFHRIFREVIQEPLNSYVTRKRIEKAAGVLMRNPEVSITELSFRYGFNGNSAFSRTFKKIYGLSPTAFRRQSPDRFSKISIKNARMVQQRSFLKNIFVTSLIIKSG